MSDSPGSNSARHPAAAAVPFHFCRVSAPCRGSSMRGTLAEGDGLRIAARSYDALRRGDVVAFRGAGRLIAHRIVGRRDGFWITQGDGNWRPDSALLSPDRFVGMVTARERAGTTMAVVGGPAGLRRAAGLHVWAFARWAVATALAPAYRLLQASCVAALFWRPGILAVRFAAPGGSIVKFVHRGRSVAQWVPQAERWTCRKPYDLVLSRPGR